MTPQPGPSQPVFCLYSVFSLYTEASQQVVPALATPEPLGHGSHIPQQKKSQSTELGRQQCLAVINTGHTNTKSFALKHITKVHLMTKKKQNVIK